MTNNHPAIVHIAARQLLLVGVLSVLLFLSFFTAHAASSTKTGAFEGVGATSWMIAGTDAVTSIESEVLTPDFSFNGLALNWPKEMAVDEENGILEVRAATDGNWSRWFPVEPLRDVPSDLLPKTDVTYSEPLFFADAQQLQYRFLGRVTRQTLRAFRATEFIYFDTRKPERKKLSFIQRLVIPRSTQADGTVPIVRRADWGADEQLRFASDGNLRWPLEYVSAQKFIIHHSAGSDGGSNPAATVRGIYYYHAVVLGWGDIGYNYLVDPAGTMYEGRYGGDAVVAGHTYNELTKTNFNRGSVGIVLLGSYEELEPSTAAMDALTALLAEKARLFRRPPTEISEFLGVTVPTIIGHNDVDQTMCPGSRLHLLLEALRARVQDQYTALGPLQDQVFAAELVDHPAEPVTIKSRDVASVTVQYKNAGNLPWQSYLPASRVAIRTVNAPATSAFLNASWISATEAGTSDAANVQPNEIGAFTLVLGGATDTTDVHEDFALYSSSGLEIPNTRFRVDARIVSLDYAAADIAHTIPPATFIREKRTASVSFLNSGTRPWDARDIRLRITDLDDAADRYRLASWPSPHGDFSPLEAMVQPGERATFRVPMTSPGSIGTYLHVLKLVRVDGVQIIADPLTVTTRADSRWQASFLSETLPLAVLRTWRPKAVVKFKNTGAAVWTRSNVRLSIYDANYAPSRFRHPSWPSAVAEVRMLQKQVRPGQTGTFVLRLQPPGTRGLYRQVLELQTDKKRRSIVGGIKEILTRVD